MHDRIYDSSASLTAQLLALEWLLGVGMPDKLKEAPLAVKALYDEDVADEVRTPADHAPCIIYGTPFATSSPCNCVDRWPVDT